MRFRQRSRLRIVPADAVDLVLPGSLDPRLTVQRAQGAGVQSTAMDATGQALATFGADIARFEGPNRRLLIGGQRSNTFTDPRNPWQALTLRIAVTLGGGANSPIGAPTNRIIETTTLSDHYIEGVVTIPANQVNSYSVYIRPAGRSSVWFTVYDSADYSNFIRASATLTGQGTVSATNAGTGIVSGATIAAVGGGWYRVAVIGAAATAASNVRIRVQIIAGSTTYAGDGVSGFDVWGLQAEAGAFPSTLILPPIDSPAASNRGGDRVFGALSSLNVSDSGACTILWRGAFAASNIGVAQTIAAVDAGGTNSRYEIRLSTGGIPEIIRVTAGVSGTINFGGSAPAPGAIVRAGMCVDGAGRLAGVFAAYNGGAPLAVTGGATTGMTTCRLGSSQNSFTREMWGVTDLLQLLPPISDAQLAAAVAALP